MFPFRSVSSSADGASNRHGAIRYPRNVTTDPVRALPVLRAAHERQVAVPHGARAPVRDASFFEAIRDVNPAEEQVNPGAYLSLGSTSTRAGLRQVLMELQPRVRALQKYLEDTHRSREEMIKGLEFSIVGREITNEASPFVRITRPRRLSPSSSPPL